MSVDYEGLFEIVKDNIFETIYNYSQITLKDNILLTAINNGAPVIGMLYTNLIAIMMPDVVNTYYMFMCQNIPISNFFMKAHQWMRLEDALNIYGVNADFITVNNKMIPKYLVYCRVSNSGETVFAIDKRAYDKFGDPTETYMIIDANINTAATRSVISSIPNTHPNVPAILAAAALYPAYQCVGFINGFAYSSAAFPTAGNSATDFYEFYYDQSIKFTFSVDLTTRNTFMCSEQNIYKDIIIIPQNFNGGEVFTYDTIELIVMSAAGQGVVLPSIASNSISQLTHASFSIASYLIDAAFDKLQITDGTLYVIVSDYNKNHVNVPNGDVTEQMYLLPDATILSAMMNKLNPEVPYWVADSLEKSKYAQYLTDMSELNVFDPTKIADQIECLGYYSFVKLLCQHNGEFTGFTSSITNLTIPIPPFWSNSQIYPIIYRDGNKISDLLYTSSISGTNINVTFNVPLPVENSSSIIQYDLILSPQPVTYQVTASQSNQTIAIPKPAYGNIHVFLQKNGSTEGISTDTFPGYIEVPLANTQFFTVIDNGTELILSFNQYSYGDNFIITTDSVISINSFPEVDLSTGKSLFFVPTCAVVGSINTSNIFTAGGYDVYLNGKYLVEGIDFTVGEILSADGTLNGGFEIILQNLRFLRDNGINSVEIYKSSRTTLSSDTGYVVDGIIPRNVNNEAWVQGISKLFVNGKLVPFEKVTKTNTNYVVDPKFCSNGNIYQFINEVSNDFYNAYSTYMDSSYFPGRQSISNYFTNGYSYAYPELIIINNGNKIFSSYLCEIINRIVAGEITVNNINDNTDIVNQLVNYEYLKQYDVWFTNRSMIDERFVEMFPGYLATISISDLNHYLYIQRLVQIVLGTDNTTDYKVVYTGL